MFGRDLDQHPRACREFRVIVGKARYQGLLLRRAVFEKDGEAIGGRFPLGNWLGPLRRGFADCQIGNPRSGMLVRLDLLVASQFANHADDRFDRVSRRDHSVDRHCDIGTTVKSSSAMMSSHSVRQFFEIVREFSSQA